MARSLSYAGRLQLIKAVLYGIQSYWSQVFLMPNKVIKLIEATCRSFLWSEEAVITRKALVGREKLSLPKTVGGLNLINLHIWNQAAICKLLWALSQNKEKLWIAWIHHYYIKTQNLFDMNIPQQTYWMIRKIYTMRKHWQKLGDMQNIVMQGKFIISKAYRKIRGEVDNVPWSKLVS